jgi:hypothetical protein
MILLPKATEDKEVADFRLSVFREVVCKGPPPYVGGYSGALGKRALPSSTKRSKPFLPWECRVLTNAATGKGCERANLQNEPIISMQN